MTHNEVIQVVSSWFKQKNEVELVSRYSPGFPEPDIFVQFRNKKTAQIECKPSGAIGREYLTGLGQAISYFTQADLSYLAIPKNEMEALKQFFWVENVGLLSIGEGKVYEIRKPEPPANIKKKISIVKRGYAYYRDYTPKEIYILLKSIEDSRVSSGFNKDSIRESIWNTLIRIRNINSSKSKSSYLTNISILLRDLKLINNSDYSILPNGSELLVIGAKEDWLSLDKLVAKLFLIDGGFIDIVALIQELNDLRYNFPSVDEFKKTLSAKILEEKLATPRTNVHRDLPDVFRILQKLDLITEWIKVDLLGGRFNVKWKNILPFVKFR
jgi:hypothetical protein